MSEYLGYIHSIQKLEIIQPATDYNMRDNATAYCNNIVFHLFKNDMKVKHFEHYAKYVYMYCGYVRADRVQYQVSIVTS